MAIEILKKYVENIRKLQTKISFNYEVKKSKRIDRTILPCLIISLLKINRSFNELDERKYRQNYKKAERRFQDFAKNKEIHSKIMHQDQNFLSALIKVSV